MLPYLWAATNARDGWRRNADYLLGLIRREADLTLAEICDRLERVRGEKVSPSMIWRFFDRAHNGFDVTLIDPGPSMSRRSVGMGSPSRA